MLHVDINVRNYFKIIKFDRNLFDPSMIRDFDDRKKPGQFTFKRTEIGTGTMEEYEQAKRRWLELTKSKFCSDLISCLFKFDWIKVHNVTIEQLQIVFTLSTEIEWSEKEIEKLRNTVSSLWVISSIPKLKAS